MSFTEKSVAPLADSHIHLFADGYPGKYGNLFPQGGELRVYQEMRKVHHITRALIVGYEGSDWAAGNNRYLAQLAPQHSWMAPLAFCRSAPAPAARQFQQLWHQGFYGISLYLMEAADGQNFLKWPAAAIDALNEKQAILSLNVPLHQLAALRPVFEQLHSTTILISHLGLPENVTEKTTKTTARRLLAPLLQLADIAHLGVKLSGFYACDEFPHRGAAALLATLCKYFGPQRLYWGSDFSPALDEVTFQQTIEAARKTDEIAASAPAIFHDNLCRAIERVR